MPPDRSGDTTPRFQTLVDDSLRAGDASRAMQAEPDKIVEIAEQLLSDLDLADTLKDRDSDQDHRCTTS